MDDKIIKSARDFLISLEDEDVCINIMKERVDDKVVRLVAEYSYSIARVFLEGVDEREKVMSAMLMGFLLKGQIDRASLDVMIK